MKLGFAIKQVRESQNINQLKLSQMIGISQTSLSQIESCTKTPRSKTIYKISQSLNTPVAIFYLLCLEENDIPKNKRNLYKMLYPSIQMLLLQLTGNKQ